MVLGWTEERRVMATVADTAKLLKLKAQIENLTPANRLRLCAELIEHGEYEIAETLAGKVVDEMCAIRILRNRKHK